MNDQSNKYLFDEPPLVVQPGLARLVGVDAGLILNQIHYWIHKNAKRESERHFHEGRYWTYNTQEAWLQEFSWMSERTLQRVLASLKSKGVILTGRFSEDKRDRTTWYSIDYQRLDELRKEAEEDEDGRVPNWHDASHKNDDDFQNPKNSHEEGDSIPPKWRHAAIPKWRHDIDTDTSTDTPLTEGGKPQNEKPNLAQREGEDEGDPAHGDTAETSPSSEQVLSKGSAPENELSWNSFVEEVIKLWQEHKLPNWLDFSWHDKAALRHLRQLVREHKEDKAEVLARLELGLNWAATQEEWTRRGTWSLRELMGNGKLIEYAKKAAHTGHRIRSKDEDAYLGSAAYEPGKLRHISELVQGQSYSLGSYDGPPVVFERVMPTGLIAVVFPDDGEIKEVPFKDLYARMPEGKE